MSTKSVELQINNYTHLNKVRMMNLSAKEKENALNEVRILASIKNTNIISYKEAFIDEDSHALCIIMEYADDGDLFQKIIHHQKNSTWFKEDFIWRIFIMVVRGLKALHDLDIMHRDLKSANVFLTKEGFGKLGDMNVSKVAEKGLSYTQTGTPYYASPEVWRDEAYDVKSDIWSLGCVLYEMITLKPPFRAENMQGLYKKVLRGHYPKISKQYSTDIQTVVRMLLQVSPKKRPNASEILSNSIVVKKIKELFLDNDEEAETETDTLKNSLLKTIYFPKNGQDILYLTDKLPKPNYEKVLDEIIDEKKLSLRAVSESPPLATKETSSNAGSYKYKKKTKALRDKSEGSKGSDTERGIELPIVKMKPSPVKHIRNSSSSVEKLPAVNNHQSTSPNKLSSVERIANRLQQESKKRPLMNIDREYNDLKKILESKQTEREQKLYRALNENVGLFLK